MINNVSEFTSILRSGSGSGGIVDIHITESVNISGVTFTKCVNENEDSFNAASLSIELTNTQTNLSISNSSFTECQSTSTQSLFSGIYLNVMNNCTPSVFEVKNVSFTNCLVSSEHKQKNLHIDCMCEDISAVTFLNKTSFEGTDYSSVIDSFTVTEHQTMDRVHSNVLGIFIIGNASAIFYSISLLIDQNDIPAITLFIIEEGGTLQLSMVTISPLSVESSSESVNVKVIVNITSPLIDVLDGSLSITSCTFNSFSLSESEESGRGGCVISAEVKENRRKWSI